MSKLLVTGTTFIQEAEQRRLAEAGHTIDRLETTTASEEELIEALKGRAGYFLGGLEKVTARVIESTDRLRAICFTGASWTEFVTGHESATERGIAITSAPGANSQAVAEHVVAMIHERVRNLSYLATTGIDDRIQTRNFADLQIGIVGAGNIGVKVGRILRNAYGCQIRYSSPSRKLDFEYAAQAQHLPLSELLATSDVVSFTMGKAPGNDGMIGKAELALLKDGAVLVNTAFGSAFDTAALLEVVRSGRVKIASDSDLSCGDPDILSQFRECGIRYFSQSGSVTAYNTTRTVQVASGVATDAMLSLLSTGRHGRVVNPESYANAEWLNSDDYNEV